MLYLVYVLVYYIEHEVDNCTVLVDEFGILEYTMSLVN